MGYYRADLTTDQPSRWRPKRVIFYAQGLKIYGLLPHLLAQRLRAQFRSNQMPLLGGHLIAPSGEANWTAVAYGQSPTTAAKLLAWLYADAGFEWALAGPDEWDDNILAPNLWRRPPTVWHPTGDGTTQDGFERVIGGPLPAGRDVLRALLPAPTATTEE